MVTKNEKIFCVICGAENEVGAKKCVKCHKNPDPKDHAFKDYLYKKGIEKGQDEGIKLLTRFLKKHLYGVLMTGSILFSGAAILANTVFTGNHIENVTARPTYKYMGEGLEAKEVVDAYANAVKTGDWATVYGLQLAKVKPDVYEEVISYTDNSSPDFGEKKPIKVHTLTKFGDIYFRDGRDYEINDYNEDTGAGTFGNYPYYRYKLWVDFHEGNSNTGVDTFWLADEVEVVEVDGNYYITGEKHYYEQMNLSDIIMRGMIYNAEGDMTKVRLYDVYDKNLCETAEDCMAKYGGMEVDQEW